MENKFISDFSLIKEVISINRFPVYEFKPSNVDEQFCTLCANCSRRFLCEASLCQRTLPTDRSVTVYSDKPSHIRYENVMYTDPSKQNWCIGYIGPLSDFESFFAYLCSERSIIYLGRKNRDVLLSWISTHEEPTIHTIQSEEKKKNPIRVLWAKILSKENM